MPIKCRKNFVYLQEAARDTVVTDQICDQNPFEILFFEATMLPFPLSQLRLGPDFEKKNNCMKR
jgi:hypothetical protein